MTRYLDEYIPRQPPAQQKGAVRCAQAEIQQHPVVYRRRAGSRGRDDHGGRAPDHHVDVKVELHGGQVTACVRSHAVALKDSAGEARQKPGFGRTTALTGKPSYMTDRDDKPWMAVSFRRLT